MLGTKMRMQSTEARLPDSEEVKGVLYTWGRNTLGQLGNGRTENVLVPTQLGIENDWSIISAGEEHVLAIKNGEVYSWGNNSHGRTGLGTIVMYTLTPHKINGLANCSHVAAGYDHSLVISEGKLFAFGRGHQNQTGLNTTEDITRPTQVGTFSDWENVVAGNSFSLGIRSGRLYAWGRNAYGKTGVGAVSDNTVEPTEIGLGFSDWKHISARSDTSLAIRNGLLYSWGWNTNGKTGQGTSLGNTLIPTQVGLGTEYEHGWTKVSVGGSHVLGLRDGKLYVWGSNTGGRLGLGTISGTELLPIKNNDFSDWEDIAAGATCSLAIRNGEIFTWGSNNNGTTGLGVSSGSQPVPVRVVSQTGWKSVSVAFHSMAIKEA